MTKLTYLTCGLLLLAACDKESPKTEAPTPTPTTATQPEVAAAPDAATEPAGSVPELKVIPLQHASMILEWDGLTIAVDPVQGALDAAPGEEPKADLVLVTDIHGDHLDAAAVAALRKPDGVVVAPQAVIDQAGADLPNPTVLANGATTKLFDGRVELEGTPMYNVERKREDSGEPFHVKGRGNGYLLTLGTQRIYISGDTECTPEMKALQNVDVAFVCMNLPYTMTVEEAAGCIAEFKPKKLYPYHHRGQEPAKLTKLLEGTPEVEIVLLDWYPASENPTGE